MFENDIDWHWGATAGFILLFPEGKLYSNQAGCTCCNHPEAKGHLILVPELSKAFDDHDLHSSDGISSEQADQIDKLLPDQVRVNRNRLAESQEAWIFVTINYIADYLQDAVLVYPNCD